MKRQFGIADTARVAFAALLLIFGPAVGLMMLDDRLSPHEHTGWFLRVVLSLPAIAGLAALFWPILWLICRGGTEGVRFTVVMFAVIYTPVSAFQVVSYFNVAFDRDPGNAVVVRYVRREVRYKGSNLDVLTSWDDADDTISLRVSSLLDRDRVPGAPVSLTVHGGWLGAEWVGQVRREEH